MSGDGSIQRPPTISLGGRTVALGKGGSIKGDRPRVDIVIAFDTTGSMSDKRDSLIRCMNEFVASLDSYRLDWRASVLPFGDLEIPGDRVDGDAPFVSSVMTATDQLAAMPRFAGGSNGGESSIEAVEAALRKPWRAGALKIVVLLTDDYALRPGRAPLVTERLVRSDTLCFVAARDAPYYREWAAQTGGSWSAISADFSAAAMHTIFRSLVRQVAFTASTIHQKALGSPQRYRALSAASRPKP